MKSQRNLIDKFYCYTLLILAALYYSQGVVLPDGEGVGLAVLVFIFGISFYYLIKMLLSKKKFTGFMTVWLLFTIMNSFYFLLYDDYTQYGLIKMVLLNFLPFFPFYYFSEKGILTRNHLIAFFLFLLPVLVVKFIRSIHELRLEEMNEDVVDNTIYMFIGLLPFVFFFKKKLFSLLFLMIIWFFMIQSAKRAAILCGIVALALFVFEYIYTSESKSKIKRYIFSAVLLFGVSYFGYNLYTQNQFLIERMQGMLQGESSGRDMLVETLLKVWYDADNLIRYLFGFGYNASRLHSVHVSHNDWVDMLVSFGLLGFMIYFALFRLLFKQVFNKNWSRDKKVILILVVSIACITSLTSRWYLSTFAYMQFLILPYLLATHEDNV
ncbi:hypothetical protein [Agriterribacter sp.]|uniref:hypothetical protein n=1 Tax=Agriterribacter sp. TaxID=2821509 RepID=UPI002CABECB2|nr:hypothetical protein [Agriterribacter sp.]HRO47705.1 hypothetical protein [Agriterribacter sp.]HRQ18080.1 hypothetical protein [Agriterribacter sp.]